MKATVNNMEKWRTIQNYEELYLVSNYGRVKALSKQSGFLVLKERILKPTTKSNGYLQVDLYKDKVRKKFYVHRLVAEAFIPNPSNLKTINHKDKNRSNNHVDNLEWMSYSENNEHGECQIKAGKSRRVPIYQCDLQGNVIKEWSCAKVAFEKLGYSNYSGINQCCKGKIKTYKGYVWKYI